MIEKGITWHEKNGLKYIKFTNLELPGIFTQGVTSRIGGVSNPPYNNLNLGYFVGDVDKNVAENRLRLREALQLTSSKMVIPDQIHSNKVTMIAEKSGNVGWDDPRRAVRMTDAIITKLPFVTLMVTAADCVPILMYDTKEHAIAAVHAGWKGTGLTIVQRTIQQMKQSYNTNAENLQVAMGPSIGVCCYTVDVKVSDFYRSNFSYWRELFNMDKNNVSKLNLIEANRRQLLESGVLDKNITSSGLCTACDNDSFFSFRKENGVTGRHMAFITLAQK